jgi:hypothetical protein
MICLKRGRNWGGKKNEIFSIFKAGRHNMFLDAIKHTQDNEYAKTNSSSVVIVILQAA